MIFVVLIHTDEGITGFGEVDTNPCGTHVLGLGLKEMLLGEDPLSVEALWDKLYSGSFMTGRRAAWAFAPSALSTWLCGTPGRECEGYEPIDHRVDVAENSKVPPTSG